MMIFRAFLIFSLFYSCSINAQQDREITEMLSDLFHEKNSPAYWQLKFSGRSESGMEITLFMAYDEKEYVSYIKAGDGKLHLFEGAYRPNKLEWVEYEYDMVKGFFTGIREDGMISAEWRDRTHNTGEQLFLVREDMNTSTEIPDLGAIFFFKGKLHDRMSTMAIDWRIDGRVDILMYTSGEKVARHFAREGNFSVSDKWVFYSPDSVKRFEITSPLRGKNIKVRYEPEKATIEFGVLEPVYSFHRSRTSMSEGSWSSTEMIHSGKQALDKKIELFVETWKSGLAGKFQTGNVWFDISDLHEDLVFGRWWASSEDRNIIPFKGMIIDMKDGRILKMEEILDLKALPAPPSPEHQLVMIEGKVCWSTPKDLIKGSNTECVSVLENIQIINKKYRDRFVQKS